MDEHIRHLDAEWGPGSRNRLDEISDPSVVGAQASLETFYFALNHRDASVLSQTWSRDRFAQANNPLGGILRDGNRIVELYERIVTSRVELEITFLDVVEYMGDRHAVFAGRESGSYSVPGATPVPLSIRTTRYLRFENGGWSQFHHHGSMDDPDSLAAYQRALRG